MREQDSICSDRLKGAEDSFERMNTEGIVIALAELNYREWGLINPPAGHTDCSGNSLCRDVTQGARQKAGKGMLAEGTAGFASLGKVTQGIRESLGALGWTGTLEWASPAPPQSRVLLGQQLEPLEQHRTMSI